MTRRAEPLIPLTHDHHHVLKAARQLNLAARGNDEGLPGAVRSFLALYDGDMLTHFREEEEQLLPLLDPASSEETRDLVVRTLLEHQRIHSLVRTMRRQLDGSGVDPRTASDLSELVRAHVRMEEDRLFPMIEREVDAEELSRVELAPRTR